MERLLLILSLLVTSAGTVRAQSTKSFDLDHLQLAVGGSDFLATEGAGRVRPWGWKVGVGYRFLNRSLTGEAGGIKQDLVENRSVLEVTAAVTFGRWVGLGLAFPMLVHQSGQDAGSSLAAGDLRIVPRLEIVKQGPFGLAILLGLRVPTGGTASFLGEGMVVFEPRIALEGYVAKRGILRIGANLGARVRQERQYNDLTVPSEIFGSVALAVVPIPALDVFGELHAATALSAQIGSARLSPVEALLGIGAGARGFRVRAAGGFGIVDGFGAPRVRAMVGLEYWTPAKAPKPVVIAEVNTPRPVAPPPAPPEPLPELPEIADRVPLPEVFADEQDVAFAQGRIELAQPIFFDTDRKRVHRRYYSELEQLARALNRRPEIKLLWIEGHADATGPAEWNLKLSRLRSTEVAKFLRKQGVAQERLKPVGYGEARPLVPTAHGTANNRNRRVHFFTDTEEAKTVAPTAAPGKPLDIPPPPGDKPAPLKSMDDDSELLEPTLLDPEIGR